MSPAREIEALPTTLECFVVSTHFVQELRLITQAQTQVFVALQLTAESLSALQSRQPFERVLELPMANGLARERLGYPIPGLQLPGDYLVPLMKSERLGEVWPSLG